MSTPLHSPNCENRSSPKKAKEPHLPKIHFFIFYCHPRNSLIRLASVVAATAKKESWDYKAKREVNCGQQKKVPKAMVKTSQGKVVARDFLAMEERDMCSSQQQWERQREIRKYYLRDQKRVDLLWRNKDKGFSFVKQTIWKNGLLLKIEEEEEEETFAKNSEYVCFSLFTVWWEVHLRIPY